MPYTNDFSQLWTGIWYLLLWHWPDQRHGWAAAVLGIEHWLVADSISNSEVRLKLQLLRYGTHVSLNPDKNTVLASISSSILSRPPRPSQPVFDSTSWSCVNPARKSEKENGNVPVVNPKGSIAARLAKLRTGLIIYLTAMFIAERQFRLPSLPCMLLWPASFERQPLGLIRISRPIIRWLYHALFKYFQINPKTVLTWKGEDILVQETKKVFEIPPQNRGQYYPWFLEHQDLQVLEPSQEPSTKVMDNFLLATHWWSTVAHQHRIEWHWHREGDLASA